MRITLAYVSMLLGAAFYGLLLIWLIAFARQGGLFQVPQMLYSLGWEAAIYGLGLAVMGTLFLLGAKLLFVRGTR